MRSFVAIDVPGTARAVGAAAGAAPEHLTLRFLGEANEERLPAIESALSGVASRSEAFRLTLSGIGGFPDIDRPRILFAEVAEGREATVRLAAHIQSALEPLGFPREARPFVPHVTLLRVRSPRDRERARQIIRELDGRTIATAEIDTLFLKSSELRPEGARHRVVAQWTFPAGSTGEVPA